MRWIISSPTPTDYDVMFVLPILCSLLTGVVGYNGGIPIGAIFDTKDTDSQRAFEKALTQHRNSSSRPFKVNLRMEKVDTTSNFQVASAMCLLMSQGVFAIVGQKSMESADIVKALSATFHMPFISTTLSSSSIRGDPSPYEFHLRPDTTRAIIDLIAYLGWRHVNFLFDSDEGLQRLHNMYRLRNADLHYYSMVRLKDLTDVHDELKMIDKMDSSSEFKGIVLDLSSEEAYKTVLRQIPEVGMNKAGYNYLLATLDFNSMELSRFRHGGVNVTGFQLLDPLSQLYISQVPAALAVDGFQVVESAIAGMLETDSDVFRWSFRRGELYNLNKTRGVPCTTRPPLPWMFGPRLVSMIKKRSPSGFTGSLTFDQEGYRDNYKLDVFLSNEERGLHKIGTWSPEAQFVRESDPSKSQSQETNDNFKHINGTYIITSIEIEPFLKIKEKSGSSIEYEGFSADLARELAKEVGFNYKFKIVSDGAYGRLEHSNNTWNGMIGELIYGVADLAIAPLTITAERERYVDFSKHFMEIGVTIMIKKPQSQRPGVFSFMEPLSIEVWLCIIIAYLTVSIGLFLVSRFSPVEWKKVKDGQHVDWSKVRKESDGVYHNDFSLFNSFWFSMGALMFQGSDSCPRSISGRIIGGAWWFFVLILISSYTANLAAFLTIERMVSPIESVDDLVNHPTIKYGAVASGATLQFFANSDVPVYKQMGNYMQAHPEVLVQTSHEGVKRVSDSKNKYAFLAESSLVEYYNERKPCDTVSVGGKLNNLGFGVATPRNSPLRDPINVAVLKLKETGALYTLHQKWWVEKGQCGGLHQSKKGKVSLTLSNVAGIFYILIVGLVIAISLGVFEFLCFRNKNKNEPNPPNDGYLRGTNTLTTLCATPNDREDSMLPYESRRQTPEPSSHSGSDKFLDPCPHRQVPEPPYIGFEKFMVDTALKTEHDTF
ncbi:glutamate receptor 3-like [Physella acuta]|uniref:glutamate receptor 3-like n=1 Tax=Physella acuta TaxID=109671 RepID=UPI0027DAF5C6|nr:glutamate receptor 3-like [Physella acuta]